LPLIECTPKENSAAKESSNGKGLYFLINNLKAANFKLLTTASVNFYFRRMANYKLLSQTKFQQQLCQNARGHYPTGGSCSTPGIYARPLYAHFIPTHLGLEPQSPFVTEKVMLSSSEISQAELSHTTIDQRGHGSNQISKVTDDAAFHAQLLQKLNQPVGPVEILSAEGKKRASELQTANEPKPIKKSKVSKSSAAKKEEASSRFIKFSKHPDSSDSELDQN
jgi:hypothetical protein